MSSLPRVMSDSSQDRRARDQPYVSRPVSEGAGIDLAYLITVLRRRALVIVATVLLVTIAVAIATFRMTPLYTASAGILIEPKSSRVVNVESVLQETPQDNSMIETKIRLITSRSFAEEVIKKLNLLEDPEFNLALRPKEDEAGWFSSLGSRITGLLPKQLLVSLGVAAPNESWPPPTPEEARELSEQQQMEYAIRKWQRGLEVVQSGSSYIIAVRYTSTGPQKAALIANKVAEIYVNDQLEAKKTATARAANWLNERTELLREQLLGSEEKVEDYRAENQLHAVQKGQGFSNQELQLINQELMLTGAAREEKVARLGLIQDRYASGEGLRAVADVMASPIIGDLRREEILLLRQRGQLSKEYGDNHPQIIQVDTDLENITNKIQGEINNVIEGLKNEIQLIDTKLATLQQDADLARKRTSAGNRAEVQLKILERDADATRSLYTVFLNRYKELSEQQDLLEPGARIVSTAAVPELPSFPKPKLMIAAAFTGSLMVGSLLALLVEQLDRGMKTTRQVEELLGIPVLGLVPSVKLPRKSDLKVHEYLLTHPRSAYAEAIRSVEISLRIASVNQCKTILVTSSLPDEGKTTLALSLATSLARSGKRAVLVDLDLRNPSVIEELREPRPKLGLIDLLRGKSTLEEVIHNEANDSELDIIANGRSVYNPSDIIASSELAELIKQLREAYEFILLDTPPLLGITDNKIAVRFADAVVLAVRWAQTKEDAALMGSDILRDSSVDFMGAVVTQVNLSKQRKMQYGDASKYYGEFSKYYLD